jgi:hypothetical protein
MSEYQFDSLIKIANNKNMFVGISLPTKRVVTPYLKIGSDTYIFTDKIPREWSSKFNELLCTEDKDWLANAFLYNIADRNGITLVRYKDNNYKKWKKERKQKEIEEWKAWKW